MASCEIINVLYSDNHDVCFVLPYVSEFFCTLVRSYATFRGSRKVVLLTANIKALLALNILPLSHSDSISMLPYHHTNDLSLLQEHSSPFHSSLWITELMKFITRYLVTELEYPSSVWSCQKVNGNVF